MKNLVNSNWSELPMVTCPHCEKEFQMDDYYDVSPNDDIDCPLCEQAIYFRIVEPIIHVLVSTIKYQN